MPWYTAAPTGKQWQHVSSDSMLLCKNDGVNLSEVADYTKPFMHKGSNANNPEIYGQRESQTDPIHYKSTIVWYFNATWVSGKSGATMSSPKIYAQPAPLRGRSLGKISVLRHGVGSR